METSSYIIFHQFDCKVEMERKLNQVFHGTTSADGSKQYDLTMGFKEDLKEESKCMKNDPEVCKK